MISVDPEQGGPGGHSVLPLRPAHGSHGDASQTQGCEAAPWLSQSHKFAVFLLFMKEIWFYFLYSCKEKKCISSSQFMQLITWTLNNFTVFPPEKIIF